MNKISFAALAIVTGFGMAAPATATTAQKPCPVQLQAEVAALQAQVAVLQSGAVIAGPGTAADIPSGG